MKKKNFIIIIILPLILFVIFGLKFLNNKRNNITKDPIYVNKIIQLGKANNGENMETFVFTKDGTYLYFVTQHYELSDLRALIGTYKEIDGKIYIKYNNAIYFDGGDIIDTDDGEFFNKRRINYNIVKKKYEYTETLEYEIEDNSIYEFNMKIYDRDHYPIYEFSTEEELSKKLEEMYGEIYTMLVDDSIQAIEDNL